MDSQEKEEEISLPYDIYYNLIPEDHKDLFCEYFNAEEEFMPPPFYAKIHLFRSFRRYAIMFMEQNSKREKFDAFIPYLAVAYMDRFISTYDIPEVIPGSPKRNTYLFLTCCLSIASKMRNDDFKIRQLLDTGNPLFRYKMEEVSKMELSICCQLKWKMRYITPIFFVDYFINRFHILSPTHPVIPRRSVHQIIIKSQAVMKLTQYRPSIVAALAVLVASSRLYPANIVEFTCLISFYPPYLMNTMGILNEALRSIKKIKLDPSEEASSSSAGPSGVKKSTVDKIPRDPDGPMDFKLDWIGLTWGELDKGFDPISIIRAYECYFCLFS
ncbi:putative cyclin-D6-1 isoform X1 [Olea europaea var. sylvestris]|uniref:putative cyclin-D6-1 isoform X1 n=1 Tax=Olea europaea var. sylvestris TaxID=158386 RepID=UPI000C1CD3A6|nr:putative cyclin-D6-1 isoform X1 [Olea europaea var. sylvestris]